MAWDQVALQRGSSISRLAPWSSSSCQAHPQRRGFSLQRATGANLAYRVPVVINRNEKDSTVKRKIEQKLKMDYFYLRTAK